MFLFSSFTAMTSKLIKSNVLTFGMLTAISISSLVFGGNSAFANPGDYALQPTCPSRPYPGGVVCYTPKTAPVLKLGSKGKMVLNVQQLMKALGYLKAEANGIYGPQTRAAVMQFQRANRITPDGVVGSGTWGAIMRANAG